MDAVLSSTTSAATIARNLCQEATARKPVENDESTDVFSDNS